MTFLSACHGKGRGGRRKTRRPRKKERISSMPETPVEIVHGIERDRVVLDGCRKPGGRIDHCLSRMKENPARLQALRVIFKLYC